VYSVAVSWASRSTVPTSTVELNCIDGLDSLAFLIKPPLYLSEVALIITIVLFSTGLLMEPEPIMPGLNFGLATKEEEADEIGI